MSIPLPHRQEIECEGCTSRGMHVQLFDWAQSCVEQSPAEESVRRVKAAVLQYLRSALTEPSFADVMTVARLVALEHRELWEVLSDPCSIASAVKQPLSNWSEQQAIKFALKFVHAVPSDEGSPLLLNALESHANISIKPLRTDDGTPSGGVLESAQGAIAVKSMEYYDDGKAVKCEGSLVCAAPIEAFGTLLRVERSDMFMTASLSGHCLLYDAIAAAAPSIFSEDETLLLISFVFERFYVGVERSHWAALLKGCPTMYPTVPIFWEFSELAELEGHMMIDEVLEKKSKLEEFHAQVIAAFEYCAPAVARYMSTRAPSDAELFLQSWKSIFSLENFQWARATFDSRAFNLNVDGTVCLALIPVADMINHNNRTDVLTRRVEPNGGPFVMEIGAALTAEDVGRELWMSYGPLQSWELVMSYGFICTDDNDNDRMPFPIAMEERDPNDVYCIQRYALIDGAGLLLGGDVWIGRSGIPPPALLALLRVQHAEIAHLQRLTPENVFTALDDELECKIVETIESTALALLDDYTTTIEEDIQVLQTKTRSREDDVSSEEEEAASSGCEGDGSEGSSECDDIRVSQNSLIAMQLRVIHKRILQAIMQWCSSRKRSLAQT